MECVILDSCFDITDTSVKELVTKCSSNMSTLDLSFCDKVTDLSLTALVDSEKARRQNSATTTSSCLQELCLAACDDLSPDAVIQAALHYSSSLRLLILDGCEKICRSFIQDYSTVKKCGNNGDALECTLDHAAVQAMLKDHRRYTPPGSPVHGSSSAFSTEAARLLTSICEEEPVAADDADNNNNTSSAPKTLKVQVSFSKTSSPSSSSDSLSSYASPPTSPKRAASVSAAPSSTVTTKRTSVTNKRMSMRMQMSLLSLKEESLDVDKSDARMERTEKIKEWRRSKMMSFPQQQCSAGGERCDDSVYNNIKHTNSSGITQHSTVSEEDGHEVRLSPSLSPDGSSSEEAMLSEAGDHAKGVLLASGRVSRSSRMMRNTTEEVIPPLSEPLPSFLKESLPRPSLILASGRRRRESVIQASPSPSSSSSISTMDAISVGKNNLSSVGNESGADDGGASWGGNVSHTDLRSAIPKNIGWGHVECPEPPAWGKDPSHWVNPAQLISNSSKLAVPVQVPVPVSSFVDPWATSPTQPPPPPTPTLAAPASQPLPFAVNHASSRDVNSGSGVVSWNQSTPAQRVSPQPQYPPPPTPSYITAQYQPPQMRQQTDIGANWGYQQHQYVPPPTEAVAPPPSVTTVVGAGWGSVSTQPPPHVNNVQPSSSTTTTTTVGWGQPPQQMISSHFQHNHSHNITNSNNNNNTSVDAAATAAPRSHEFIFSNSDRGRLLLKLKIETKNGGHQTLPVHEV